MDVNYNPTQLLEGEKNVHGTPEAGKRACSRWLQRVEAVIRSDYPSEVKRAYRHLTRSKGLQGQLDRKILIHDISVKATLQTLQYTI